MATLLFRTVTKTSALVSAARPHLCPAVAVRLTRGLASDGGHGGDSGGGDSITYSGGQATSGQGGFYGAGGARAHSKPQ